MSGWNPMKKEFYSVMGWDDEGRPTAEKLAELGIDPIAYVDQAGSLKIFASTVKTLTRINLQVKTELELLIL